MPKRKTLNEFYREKQQNRGYYHALALCAIGALLCALSIEYNAVITRNIQSVVKSSFVFGLMMIGVSVSAVIIGYISMAEHMASAVNHNFARVRTAFCNKVHKNLESITPPH